MSFINSEKVDVRRFAGLIAAGIIVLTTIAISPGIVSAQVVSRTINSGDITQALGFTPAIPNSWITAIGPFSGTPTTYSCLAGPHCYDINHISITSDTAAAGTTTVGPSGFGVQHIFGGTGMTGSATGISSYFLLNQTTSNSGGQYVGQLSIASASVPDTSAAIWGGDDNVFLGNGATGWHQVIGREIDVSANTGSSVLDKLGLQIVQPPTDAVVASQSNIGVTFNNASGATGWDCMVCAGGYAGYWPMNANGTIIGAWAHATARNGSGASVPTGSAGTVLYGLDFANVTFGAGGAPIVMPLITPASSSTTCKAGATEWDASFWRVSDGDTGDCRMSFMVVVGFFWAIWKA